MEYIIIGYYPERDSWNLVKLAGREKEKALELLKRLATEPTEKDKISIGGATILSIDTVESKTAWWNDPTLAN